MKLHDRISSMDPQSITQDLTTGRSALPRTSAHACTSGVASHHAVTTAPRKTGIRLSRAAECLLDDAMRKDIQACPQSVQAFADAMLTPLCVVVGVASRIRAHSPDAQVQSLCESLLPGLIANYSPRNGDPVASFVHTLTDRCVSGSRASEAMVTQTIAARAKQFLEGALGSLTLPPMDLVEPEVPLEALDELIAETLAAIPDREPEASSSPGDTQAALIAPHSQEVAGTSSNQWRTTRLLPCGGFVGVQPSPEACPDEALSTVRITFAGRGRSLEVRELERELRREEHISETLRALFEDEDLSPQDRLLGELFYLHGAPEADLAVVIDKSLSETRKMLSSLREQFIPRFRSPMLVASGNDIRRAIERADLKLEESDGLTLLRSLSREYPNLRRTSSLLDLVADSFTFFEDLCRAKDPEAVALRKDLVPRSGLDLNTQSQALKALIRSELHRRYPTPEDVRYDRDFAWLLGFSQRQSRVGNGSVSKDALFLGACIAHQFYSPRIHRDSVLTVPYEGPSGIRNVRNPLTRVEAVGIDQARENSHALLRAAFPNLDAVRLRSPGAYTAKSLLGLPEKAPIALMQTQLVRQGVLEGQLPDGYEPERAASAYFQSAIVGQAIEINRSIMVRRLWGTIDDPDGGDKYMANILGVPATTEALTRKAIEVLGPEIPDGHPFNYSPKRISRYFELTYMSPNQREYNVRKSLRQTFVDLNSFTHDRVKAEVGFARMARILVTKSAEFDDLRRAVEERGYLV